MAKTKRRQATKGFSRSQRFFMISLAVFLIGIGGFGVLSGNRGVKDPIRAASVRATARLAVASVSPLNSNSSSWYCNWYLPGQGGVTKASVLIANTSSKELTANLRTYDGKVRQNHMLKIPPHSFLRFPEPVTPKMQYGAASFIANGGGTVAEMEITGHLGTTLSPCNSSPSAHWVGLGANTLPGSSSGISIFNPFDQDAVVDVSLSSGSNQFAPGAMKGVVIAPHSFSTFDLTKYFAGQAHVAVSVSTRIGRVVLGGIVQRNDNGNAGLAALATFPATASQWNFPVGELSDNQNQNILVYNPNESDATVELKFSYLQLEEVNATTTTTTTSSTTTTAEPKRKGKTTTTVASQPGSSDSGGTLTERVPGNSVSVISVKAQTTVQTGKTYRASLSVKGGLGVVAADEFVGSASNPNLMYQVVGGTPLNTDHWIALYDPSALGVSNAQAWLATVDTGKTYPVSHKTPLVDLGPTYLVPPGKPLGALPTLQAQLAQTTNKPIEKPKDLNSVGSLSKAVTGLIVSSKTPFALGSVMGKTPGDLYVVPVLPFAN